MVSWSISTINHHLTVYTMKVYIAASQTQGTGGFEWRTTLEEARKEFESDKAIGCIRCLLFEYETKETNFDDITKEIDGQLDLFETKQIGTLLDEYEEEKEEEEEDNTSYHVGNLTASNGEVYSIFVYGDSDYYDIHDSAGSCINEGEPFYEKPTQEDLEDLLSHQD